MTNDYYSQTRQEMLCFLPEKFKTVLDIGCGQAIFSEKIKKDYLAEVWGIEYDKESARIAKEKIDKVLEGEVSELVGELPDEYFDVVFCNDILEHLVDPYSLISFLRKKIKPGGLLISSIPNVRYLLNLKKLMIDKDWKYEDYGILDRTHLRFFTKNSIARMFNEAGYEIEKLEGINAINSWKFKLLNFFFLGLISDTKYLQFACVARN